MVFEAALKGAAGAGDELPREERRRLDWRLALEGPVAGVLVLVVAAWLERWRLWEDIGVAAWLPPRADALRPRGILVDF